MSECFKQYKAKLRRKGTLRKNGGIEDPNWKPDGWDQEAFGPHGRCPMCKSPNLLELDGSVICPECNWGGESGPHFMDELRRTRPELFEGDDDLQS